MLDISASESVEVVVGIGDDATIGITDLCHIAIGVVAVAGCRSISIGDSRQSPHCVIGV